MGRPSLALERRQHLLWARLLGLIFVDGAARVFFSHQQGSWHSKSKRLYSLWVTICESSAMHASGAHQLRMTSRNLEKVSMWLLALLGVFMTCLESGICVLTN